MATDWTAARWDASYAITLPVIAKPRRLPAAAIKDQSITYGNRYYVVPGLHPVTCGRVVHKLVDNRSYMRITGFILWISCGLRKVQNKMGWTSCGRRGKGVENISPSETGTTRRKLRDVEEAGKPGVFRG